MTLLDIGVRLETITCGSTKCGIVFAAPQPWVEGRMEDHTTWYCPNGHARQFTGETEKEKLRKQLATAQGNLNYYQQRSQRLGDEVRSLERSRSALKGQTTKLRKRAANGVCAFCNRSFANYKRHMDSKHPSADEPA